MKTKAQLAYEFDMIAAVSDGRSPDRQINGVVNGTLTASTEVPTMAQKAETMRRFESRRDISNLIDHIDRGLESGERLMAAMTKAATTRNLLDTNRCVYTVLDR